MASPYVITIVNGTGTADILNGLYTTSAAVTGYNNVSILPATQTISAATNTYPFTIAATGTLTLHVTENGTVGGIPVVGATFVRCDSAGATYGAAITTGVNGDAVFNFVPFAATNAPLIYYKQTASDGNHEFDPTLVNTALITSAETIEVINPLPATRTINLTDVNYAGLPIVAGTITLT